MTITYTEGLCGDGAAILRDGVPMSVSEILDALNAAAVREAVPEYPENLPCPVHLLPGLKFGQGVPTRSLLEALTRRAEYEAELDAMTPEQKAEHDAAGEWLKSMLPTPAPATGVDDDVRNIIELLESDEWAEHCTETVLGSRLESEITRLIGRQALAVHPGYKLVPVAPTPDMIAAAMDCEDVLFNDDDTFCIQFGNIYSAMLAAAPEVKP